MNDLDARFDRARAAWERDRPDDHEVQAAVDRLRRRLARPPRRRRPARVVALLAAAVLGVGIAHAMARAFGSSVPRDGASPPAASAMVTARHSLPAAAAGASVAPAVTSTAAPTPAAPSASTPSSPAVRPAGGAPVGDRVGAAAWHRVDAALARGDRPTARVELSALAASGDPVLRDHARLSLVQLAVAEGDCARATTAAAPLATASDSTIRARARVLVAGCGR